MASPRGSAQCPRPRPRIARSTPKRTSTSRSTRACVHGDTHSRVRSYEYPARRGAGGGGITRALVGPGLRPRRTRRPAARSARASGRALRSLGPAARAGSRPPRRAAWPRQTSPPASASRGRRCPPGSPTPMAVMWLRRSRRRQPRTLRSWWERRARWRGWTART